MKHLEVRSLSFDRGAFNLRASLSLDRGTTGVILGPSGCGKTTLLRCIAGLEKQSGGAILINGKEAGDLPPERRNIGFVFQDLALFDHLTGRNNIDFGLRLKKNMGREEAAARVDELAKKLQIGSLLDRKPFAMSGGERQRLAFARALAGRPDLLLLDEPLSSLDAPLRRELRTYLKKTLSLEGTTALHVTHDVEEAFELGDKIFLMNAGRILVSGAPELLYENPPDAWCVRFLGLGSLLPVSSVEVRGNRLIAATEFGPLSCPSPGPSADLGAKSHETGKTFFYFPRRAARLGESRDVARQGPEDMNLVDAVVERVVFMGDRLRVSLNRLPPGGIESRGIESVGLSGASEYSFEIEVEGSIQLSPGQKVRVAVDASLCRLLPLHG